MHDLNSLVVSGLGGMTLTIADDINDVGQIVGTGCDASGTTCLAFRLDPVSIAASASPVPALSQWMLLVMVLTMIGVATRHRHR